ncbi:type IV toxin-antitoxin system AbiEi family antitoxin [Dyadobacter sp. 32]|uniref:type IV toxin-antitoxin system AbiEi family antitoxin domain-containing protein n=1 Tax=Dyadobacter sp. 32 TaxID=538966 RepID=UPI0011EE4DC7
MPSNPDRRRKLEKLMPEGSIVTRQWLMEKASLSKHAVDNLVKSQQLRPLSKGVYTRGSVSLSWQSIVCTLQSIMNTDYLIGGLTALELKGFSHYIPGSRKTIIHLYGNDKWPIWVDGLISEITFVRHRRSELFATMDPATSQQCTSKVTWGGGTQELNISRPERACLEMMADVPNQISFEHAEQLFQGMTTLSPRTLQRLLEDCTSIKTKRLFLWFATRNRHSWLAKIIPERIDLGSGNRVIAENGELDKTYQITVPKQSQNA